VISSSQRPLPDNTQHPKETNVHASGGTRTRNRSKPAATIHNNHNRQTSKPTAGLKPAIPASQRPQYTARTRDKHACFRRDSNPQSQQASGYNTQHSQEANFHASGGNRIRNPNKPAATIHNTQKRQTSMPPVGLEPAIPASNEKIKLFLF